MLAKVSWEAFSVGEIQTSASIVLMCYRSSTTWFQDYQEIRLDAKVGFVKKEFVQICRRQFRQFSLSKAASVDPIVVTSESDFLTKTYHHIFLKFFHHFIIKLWNHN